MNNVAYKVSKGNPNLPDGFVLEHYETDETTVDGYTVVPKDSFSAILANNAALLQNFEANTKGVVIPNPTPPAPATPQSAESLSSDVMAEQQAIKNQAAANAALFQQFLTWKASQGSSS